jgi:hypothetical protein
VAAALDGDEVGLYAVVECDHAGCSAHVALRPALPDVTPYELIRACVDMALDEGWLLMGRAYCPAHQRYRRDRTVGRVGEGLGWTTLHRTRPDGAPRPS